MYAIGLLENLLDFDGITENFFIVAQVALVAVPSPGGKNQSKKALLLIKSICIIVDTAQPFCCQTGPDHAVLAHA